MAKEKTGAAALTNDLLPTQKKRGRPTTGTAKTAAERKRDSRSKAFKTHSPTDDLSSLSFTQILEALSKEKRIAGMSEDDELKTKQFCKRLMQNLANELKRKIDLL